MAGCDAMVVANPLLPEAPNLRRETSEWPKLDAIEGSSRELLQPSLALTCHNNNLLQHGLSDARPQRIPRQIANPNPSRRHHAQRLALTLTECRRRPTKWHTQPKPQSHTHTHTHTHSLSKSKSQQISLLPLPLPLTLPTPQRQNRNRKTNQKRQRRPPARNLQHLRHHRRIRNAHEQAIHDQPRHRLHPLLLRHLR
jgi:hypothetical protein